MEEGGVEAHSLTHSNLMGSAGAPGWD